MTRYCLLIPFLFLCTTGMNVLSCEAFALNTPLADTPISYLGAFNYKYSGWATSAGDVDGDGLTDLLIGGGRVYLMLGKNIGTKSGTTIEDFADASFLGEDGSNYFGDSLCAAGDVNNDGFDDILIGAPNKTYLILGKATGWAMNTNIVDTADSILTGEKSGDYFGYSLAFAGDINKDNFDDFMIGAYLADDPDLENAGKTYLFLGSAAGWNDQLALTDADVVLVGENGYEGSSRTVAAAGDVNNDGFSDFLIGATSGHNKYGEIYLFLGAEAGWTGKISLGDADGSFHGEYAGDFAGNSVSTAGDVNGDGFDDLLIGVDENDYYADRAGKVYLVLGKATDWGMDTNLSSADGSFYGVVAGDHVGGSVSPAGDVNNDGMDDFLVGAIWADQWAGKAYLIYGKSSGWEKNVSIGTANGSFSGEAPYDYAGFSFTALGDMNRDGNDDFLISAAYFGSYYTGKAYLLYSDEPVVGDLDGDGVISLPDAIIGLQLLTDGSAFAEFGLRADIDDDDKIGMAEIVFVLRNVSGNR